jgi:hypothetical protein
MAMRRKIGIPTASVIDDIWQRKATSAAILALRDVINGGAVPPATPVGRLEDVELGWIIAAGLFAWIKTRAEQATAEGMDVELALRLTGHVPEAWDAGCVANVLPEIGKLEGIDWSLPVAKWPKDMVIKFLLGALSLVRDAMIARDFGGGGVSSRRKSLPEMQRVASAEAGGSLVTPDEFSDPIGI